MHKIQSFKDVIAWQKAYELTKLIYKHTKNFPNEEKFGLTSQIRRSAVSVVSNIVEGFARLGIKDGLSFYNIANASLEELKCQLMLGFDFGYIDKRGFDEVWVSAEEASKVLRGWMNSQKL
jgi:four helix bundle protein